MIKINIIYILIFYEYYLIYLKHNHYHNKLRIKLLINLREKIIMKNLHSLLNVKVYLLKYINIIIN
jgi:hypothetical protein